MTKSGQQPVLVITPNHLHFEAVKRGEETEKQKVEIQLESGPIAGPVKFDVLAARQTDRAYMSVVVNASYDLSKDPIATVEIWIESGWDDVGLYETAIVATFGDHEVLIPISYEVT